MFTKEQLEGIIVALASPEISIERDDKQSIGYRIRLRVHFRAMNNAFILGLKEALEENGIDTYYRSEEKGSRPYPLLRITKVDNLLDLFRLIPPKLENWNDKFNSFLEVLTIVSNKHHLTQKGFDRILEIKGEWST
tara:strand:+ start:26 stop:433 length:408 start_codon:yes stop_codon:yes gene_type:complete